MPEDYAAKRRALDLIAKDIAFRHAQSAQEAGQISRDDIDEYAGRKYRKDMSAGAVDPTPGWLLALEQGKGLVATGKALASGIPDAISAAKSYIPKSLDELSSLPKAWREALQKQYLGAKAGAFGGSAPGSVPPPRGLGGPPPDMGGLPGTTFPQSPGGPYQNWSALDLSGALDAAHKNYVRGIADAGREARLRAVPGAAKAYTELPVSTPVDPSSIERLHGYLRSEILSGAGAPAEKARALKALEAGRQTLDGYVKGGLPVTKGDLLQHMTPHKSLRPEVEGKLFGI